MFIKITKSGADAACACAPDKSIEIIKYHIRPAKIMENDQAHALECWSHRIFFFFSMITMGTIIE